MKKKSVDRLLQAVSAFVRSGIVLQTKEQMNAYQELIAAHDAIIDEGK